MLIDWSLADIGSLDGRRVLITGGNSGIGFQTARELLKRGACVVLGCRCPKRGEAALAEIHREMPGALAEVLLLDLSSIQSIRAAVALELSHGLPLDVLINNAGVMSPPDRKETVDGFELQFGVNVLGHFLLTALLLPALERAEMGRVVTVASIAHKRGRMYWEDLQESVCYNPGTSYAQSKLANLLFAQELERYFQVKGSRVRSFACHPGVASTHLFVQGDRAMAQRAVRWVLTWIIWATCNNELQGALPTLFCATSDRAQAGGYYGPQGFREMRGGDVGTAAVAPAAQDPMAASRLWSVCQELLGYPFTDGCSHFKDA